MSDREIALTVVAALFLLAVVLYVDWRAQRDAADREPKQREGRGDQWL